MRGARPPRPQPYLASGWAQPCSWDAPPPRPCPAQSQLTPQWGRLGAREPDTTDPASSSSDGGIRVTREAERTGVSSSTQMGSRRQHTWARGQPGEWGQGWGSPEP